MDFGERKINLIHELMIVLNLFGICYIIKLFFFQSQKRIKLLFTVLLVLLVRKYTLIYLSFHWYFFLIFFATIEDKKITKLFIKKDNI